MPPATISIGPYTYDVVLESIDTGDAESDFEGYLALGAVNIRDLTITLEPAQHPLMMRNSLLHEVLHAIRNITGEAGDEEEAIVCSMSALMLDTLRRNPELVSYLIDAENS